MRFLALCLALVSTPAAAQLKPFDFMGIIAGEPIPPAKLKGCRKLEAGICIKEMVQISNVWANFVLTTHDNKLSKIYIDVHPNWYVDLRAAFVAKYGEPCERAKGVWKNAAGAELDNPIEYWCFSSGRLKFARYGARIDKMDVLYLDDNKAPAKPPVVNF